MVSAVAVPSYVHLAISEALISVRISEGYTNASEPMEVSDNRHSEKSDKLNPVKMNSAASLVGALDDTAGEFVSVRQFRRENYQIVDVVANLDQIFYVPYKLRKVKDEHKQKLRVSL